MVVLYIGRRGPEIRGERNTNEGLDRMFQLPSMSHNNVERLFDHMLNCGRDGVFGGFLKYLIR